MLKIKTLWNVRKSYHDLHYVNVHFDELEKYALKRAANHITLCI